MKINKKTLYFGGIIALLLVGIYFNNKSSQKEIITNIPELKNSEELVLYSRINFFLTGPNKASLAIPDYWEGNYRKKEQGDESIFYFVSGVDEIKLFSISYREEDNIELFSGQAIIANKNNKVFIFTQYNNDFDNNIFNKMTESIKDVIKSFKVS